MKKILLTLAVIGVAAFSSVAQTTTAPAPANGGSKLNIGIEGGLPLGDASNGYTVIIGGSIKYEVPTGKNTFFTVSAGYNSFLANNELKEFGLGSEGFIPVKAGLKYYSDEGFFIEGQLGVVFSTESGGGHAFAYSPGIGYTLKGGFEVGFRYEGWVNDGTVSQLGLRLGYRF